MQYARFIIAKGAQSIDITEIERLYTIITQIGQNARKLAKTARSVAAQGV